MSWWAVVGASGGDISRRKKGLALVLCFWAQGAAAQMTCTFETECLEGEGCAEGGLEIALTVEGVMETTFGDLPAAEVAEGTWMASADGIVSLLTVGEDGTARASFHLEGPLVVTYLGRCEGE